ncbi:glycosyltransferase [Candidatus Uhrbacteria bacterium]|nr:glycosyltransferase [Candidatus Uhrbacteria bacterium]
MKIAFVHDFLVQNGGAERVLRALHALWPEAPIYTIVHDKKRTHPDLQGKDIRPSFLQKMPFGLSHYQWFLPWMPRAIESHNLMEYDVVLSSSSAFAKGVITGPRTLHICYCHTPTRYLWTDTHTYIRELAYNRLVKHIIPFLLTNLRLWDQMTAHRVDHFIANSKNVQERIKKYYRRESVVVHPPIDTSRFSLADRIENYYLIGGRLVSYKRYDLAVQAFSKMGIPLVVFGEGPEYARLQAMAKPNVQFVGKVSDEELARLYRHAIAFLHPQEEDLGLTALEAMASGRPVIAYAKGGALETVVPGVTGTFFEEQTWESLADTVLHFNPLAYDAKKIRAHAEQFDVQKFQAQVKGFVENAWESFRK